MNIDISKLVKGETILFENLKMPDNVDELKTYNAVIKDICVNAQLTKLNKNVFAEGTIEANIVGPCARCNRPAEENLKIEFSEMFYHVSEEFKEDGYNYSGNVLDLEPLVLEYILLNFSGKLLCKESCKGLCENCGKNLNEGECNCKKNKEGLINPANPMRALAKIQQKKIVKN